MPQEIEIGSGDLAAFDDYALAQGWSDGLPLHPPTREKVAAFVELVRGANEPLPPLPPRQGVATLESLAANAVMAGCRPEYFPVVLAALKALLVPDYNLHGTLATTHSCSPMVMISGPLRRTLELNCGSNCFGQGWRANATIGRAINLILMNVAGAKPGTMDRSTHGSPAKVFFCFGENEEESPWPPYHVRNGYALTDSVVTVMASEPPHNINDHGSTTGEGLLITMASTMSTPGANTVFGKGPLFVAIGPEHAVTLHRDGYTIEKIQDELFARSRVHISRVSPESDAVYSAVRPRDGDWYPIAPNPKHIHVVVAGGAGKHSAFMPSFGGTAVVSQRVV